MSSWSYRDADFGQFNEQCKGNQQSPIDIPGNDANTNPTRHDLKFVSFSIDGCNSWKRFVNAYTLEVDFKDMGCRNLTLHFSHDPYTLEQLHFHFPSEHSLNSRRSDAEIHMVHRDVQSNILVLAVFLKVAEVTPVESLMSDIWGSDADNISAISDVREVIERSSYINPYKLVNNVKNRGLFSYMGSLTTPPCSQNVRWLVSDAPYAISQDDLDLMRGAVGHRSNNGLSLSGTNNRDQQPLNGRSIDFVGILTLGSWGHQQLLQLLSATFGVMVVLFCVVFFVVYKQWYSRRLNYREISTEDVGAP